MDDPRRRFGRLLRVGSRHRRTENRVPPEAIASVRLRDGERRQRLQHKRIGEKDAHHVARQIPQPLPPTGACHGLPQVHIRRNT